MNYRSVTDLNRIIVENLHRIPNDVDLIVGVPRSGILAANLVALHRNLPLTDVTGYAAGRLMNSGNYRAGFGNHRNSVDECRRALVIDDSILSGSEMGRVRETVQAADLTNKTLFGAIFYVEQRADDIDIGFELCPTPRVFEWHLMHGHMLPKAFVDIDGVLCVDPTDEQNDDGERYIEFLRTATPLLKPSARIGTLITSRLEKYRSHTEAWLKEHDVEYENLVMMQYATMEERKAAQQYAQYKASAYAKSEAILFIESSDPLAADIARLSGKPALCVETHNLYGPSGLPYARQQVKSKVKDTRSLAERGVRKIARIIKGQD